MRRWIPLLMLGIASGFTHAGDWSEPLKLRLGPDSNACGILLPKPLKPRPVILWLHGGMHSQNTAKGWTAMQALPPFVKPGSYYLCSPSSYVGADWLTPQGLAHIDTLLNYMASHYSVRMDKLIIVGVSDGCLGALRYAKEGRRKVSRFVLFSSYPPLAINSDDLLKDSVYLSTRWDVFQGGRDRLFPSEQVFPLLKEWANANPKVKLHLYPEGEHDFSWYTEHAAPEIRQLFK
jgi:pimeloyl-ACP methyl ester carboxylesterase